MTASPKGRRGLHAFRLGDVPESVRLAAYNRVMDLYEGASLALFDPGALADMAGIGAAAASPSDKVYWIPREVWERESRKQTWTGRHR